MIKILVKHKEILLYLFFGVSTTAVNWIIYFLFTELYGAEMTVNNALAWAGAVIFAFVTNKLFVFESKNMSLNVLLKESISFLGARMFSGLFEIFLPTLLFKLGLVQSLFGIEGFFAKAIVSVLVVILNYMLSKVLIFRKNDWSIYYADDKKRTNL